MKRIELIAPAGNLEKLKTAIQFGADAVYLGDKRFSLRACADNFGIDEIKSAVDYARKKNVMVYVTINCFAHNEDIELLRDYILELKKLKIDGVVVSDPGVFSILQKIAPEIKIHLSTQSNTLNYESVKFWEKLGVSRIILARELKFGEIKKIKENTSIELEVFIHGAMCMAYSGRCMLSSYLTGRDANKGDCAHPCRYKYSLGEEKRPGQYFDIEEDGQKTYILSSKDLCTIKHIQKFIDLGIIGFKIEGRMKGIYYLAVVTRSYRHVIDEYLKDPKNYVFNNEWEKELSTISHREYTAGFYFERDSINMQADKNIAYFQKYDLVGVVKNVFKDNLYVIECRNRIRVGDQLEVLTPGENIQVKKIEKIYDLEMNELQESHANDIRITGLLKDLPEGSLLRHKK
ncbi:MAG: U32 family peptidase [bacterium]|nr:U32 family peptidase [bacterium]